jgi:hypothetical protein
MNNDSGGRSAQHLVSEQEEKQSEKKSIIRCGKILWRSIIFGLYMLLVIVVVQTQIAAHNSFIINKEINDRIHSLTSDSTQDVVSFDNIKNKNDTLTFLKNCLPKLGELHSVSAAINENLPNVKSEYTGYFIDDRKYLVGDLMRFKFQFAQKNPLMNKLQKEKLL